MSDNWVVSTLEDALNSWNNKLTEIWSLVSQTPESFRGGEIWTVIVGIHNALVGFGYGLLVLFFAIGVFRSAASFRELQRPENLRWCGQHRHGRHWFCNFYNGHPAR